ncbi:hypothetical protein JX266_012683 [Neoarthrinium moseri]|nr:hypothetical protein JX266_012683 [Neoarthrinium moseri]
MMRRPPGEGRLVAEQPRTKVLLALAIFILPWLSLADAQQQQYRQQQSLGHHPPPIANVLHPNGPSNPHLGPGNDDDDARDSKGRRLAGGRGQHRSPFEGQQLVGSHATTLPQASVAERPRSPRPDRAHDAVTTAYANDRATKQKRSADQHYNDPHDASALATLAPEHAVRAAKSPRQPSGVLVGAGLSSTQSARSLERWEVEDYALLATVDGHLYAVSKDSGDVRWHLEVEQPTVETIHHRSNRSLFDDHDPHPLDDYIWAIEPSYTGPVFVWMPSGVGSGLMSTGFSMKELVDDLGPYAVQHPPVVYTGDKKTTMYILDAATGSVRRWFGQGEHQVAPVATCFQPKGFVDADTEECSDAGTIALSRTEYTVNIHRQDDGRPIATLRYFEWGPNSHDNDLHRQYRANQDKRYLTSRHDGKLYTVDDKSGPHAFSAGFSAPVARVFNVARPLDVPRGTNPELVLLPQSAPPFASDKAARARGSSIYLNKTEAGSWYAMSGTSYPLILDAPLAQVSLQDGTDHDDNDFLVADEALIGMHALDGLRDEYSRESAHWPSLPPGLPSGPDDGSRTNSSSVQMREEESDLTSAIERGVKSFPEYAAARMRELITNPIVLVGVLIWLIYWLRTLKRHNSVTSEQPRTTALRAAIESFEPVKETLPDGPTSQPIQADDVANTAVHELEIPAVKPDMLEPPPAGTIVPDKLETPGEEPQPSTEAQLAPQATVESPEKKKKKAHRGTRGGVKHKRGKKQQDASQTPEDKPADIDPITHVDQMVEAQEPKLNPNVKSIGKPEDIGAGGFEINGLRVNLDEQLGMGSNGTVVFPGSFHGREIAVKRMLHEFNDLATRETDLLLESDNHPNVIQYYAIHRDKTFLYIALERCHASLADIVDKPHSYQDLAQAGERDIPNVLLQIANGVSHLHSLRIVHRDLKPQNILVTMTKEGRPRLVVSDFGLCKKLDGAQSSFGHTATRPAGTSGWRAPELLAEEDARDNSTSMTSTHSESSQLVSSDLLPNRRATRAIDIFSLGLVFFYVLTKGSHPFDCGDRYMREVNIRKGQLNLQPLDVLGDFAFEARDLIRNMLRTDPRLRPTTKEVMAHPFFWDSKKRLTFLCDVSDHFEKEQRDPPSEALATLESFAPRVCRGDFLKALTKDFVESLGKQRKYTGTRLLDLLRALRNKWNHREDLSDSLKKSVGTSHEDYLGYWTRRFPNLLVVCCEVVYTLDLQDIIRFREYFEPMKP